ncbi:4-[[4-(2-aminoethyl)phenoxy]-methyl]-2-furanmethanamine-glutamate synthase [hydrothermal vent metagenome]|uniref:4-[[4-(2-aminoethyl)phenoxy]-methyl]-2-furanmethanamine-glutamate synthase n=1 Tax=hydrothermal vent metagenome TaxID=652676 RepID=A0A3B1BQG3_9ZZZZ
MRVLGLDIGGANIKYALARGKAGLPTPRKIPFELFRDPQKLIVILEKIRTEKRPDTVALTMTGELADVFSSRKEGVRFIIESVMTVFKNAPIKIIDVNGDLIFPAQAIKHWKSVASANWAATGRWVASKIENCTVVDIGSTTTDIIPIKNGKVTVKGKNDFDRLRTGELLYKGYLRTNSAMVCPVIHLDGKIIEACPEYFSIIGDAHLYLGDIIATDYTCPTPDSGPKTVRGCARRMARLVLSEAETIGEGGTRSIARQLVNSQGESIAKAVYKIAGKRGIIGAPMVLAGSGEIYKRSLRKKIKMKFVKTLGGAPISRVDPASCLSQIALRLTN